MDRKVASAGWEGGQLLAGKTLIVTGCASGIGLETAGLIKDLGGDVIGVDREMTTEHVDELYRADLSDKRMIQALVKALPEGADGIANMAGLSPDRKSTRQNSVQEDLVCRLLLEKKKKDLRLIT